MNNVRGMYEYLCGKKQELIDYNLINKDGFNNFGFALWSNYDFDFDL